MSTTGRPPDRPLDRPRAVHEAGLDAEVETGSIPPIQAPVLGSAEDRADGPAAETAAVTVEGKDSASGLLGSSAVMAAGTVVSRLSGFARSSLLLAALGAQLHADIFNVANTVPNMLYILLAGGVFNAVLVPQLVRATKQDADGGTAYTERVVTVAAVFLLVVSVVLVVAAPLLMRLFLDPSYDSPALADQRDSVIAFARYCLPQVFFYGMFVLLGQVLNARRSFGPMMWAPIANNVISVVVLVAYLSTFGPVSKSELSSAFTSAQELVLGLGSTLGIAAQLAVLVPYLRRAGVRLRPRFDLRGSGLGHTLRLGVWTVLFVIANQVAYTVVVRIASSGTASGSSGGTGYTVYSNSFLLIMVPHAVVTVSLATAMLPRLSSTAADRDLGEVGRGIGQMMRTTFALIVPFALLIPVVSRDVPTLVFGYGAGSGTAGLFGPTLSLFALGLVFFTSHYLVLRGFYALERTRTVFFIQVVVSAVNIVLAVALTRGITAGQTSPRLVLAYSGAYAVGAVLSYVVLSRLVGGLQGGRLLEFALRIVPAAAIAAGLAWAAHEAVGSLLSGDGKVAALVSLLVTAAVDGAVLLVLARMAGIVELTSVLDLIGRRLGLRRRGGHRA
ncbi:hypothetical protein GCM10011519_21570 [Marmoricola endophyticus]|uniref:Murein biosynthesis integral membrane protein MurJ n=1 Tax=Marmoricola endophyticus TaxID=2040280 RepID=A0A917BJ73_9ACTN|nr:murein biosynthesis integral membrane protein MurJ [Marmoricola endophyticus]GGF47209.1 hypothetical protein GCM10011519_21570 [Marmoricola endophyticus]